MSKLFKCRLLCELVCRGILGVLARTLWLYNVQLGLVKLRFLFPQEENGVDKIQAVPNWMGHDGRCF